VKINTMNNYIKYLNKLIEERNFVNKNYKFLKVSHLHDILGMYHREEISYSRMVEIINALAFDHYKELIK
jgi:hypothetical protein